MKILALDDLHFECVPDRGLSFIKSLKSNSADVLSLAGDILNTDNFGLLGAIFERFCDKFEDVVFVAGNHEFYFNDIQQIQEEFREIATHIPNLHILDNSTAEIQGQRFIGGTGWFKKDLNTTQHDKNCMGDFAYIKNFEPWVYRKNRAFNELLQKELCSTDVVVSHHLPSYQAVAPQFKNSRLNQFFVNDCEKLIKERQPKLWLYGHSHVSMDFHIGKTRLINNSRGYPREGMAMKFNPNLIIEL